jgi:1-acyl-sn-glycerol-3-phosphate acyltransferase
MSRRPYAQLEMAPLYGFSHALIEIIYDICFRGEIAGTENLSPSGGYIVASNHASFLDPPIVGLFLPRQVSFFARKSLWKPGVASWWLDGVGTIPVDREGGADIHAIKRVLRTLETGGVVLLFPEGTRSPDNRLQKPKPGIGMIACRSQVPVVPARVFGSFEALGRGGGLRAGTPISVTYGPPLAPADYDDPAAGKDLRYSRAAEHIMAAIARLQPPEVRVI